MTVKELPRLNEQDFTRGLLIGLARHGITAMPDPRLDMRPSDAAVMAFNMLEDNFTNVVNPCLYIKCGPHGFATSWIETIKGFITTLLRGCDQDGMMQLDVPFLLHLDDSDLPGPRYMWDVLTKVFIAEVENVPWHGSLVIVPADDVGNSNAVAQEIVKYIDEEVSKSDLAEKFDIVTVPEEGELDYPAITAHLRMSLRFLNVSIVKFDAATRTYTVISN